MNFRKCFSPPLPHQLSSNGNQGTRQYKHPSMYVVFRVRALDSLSVNVIIYYQLCAFNVFGFFLIECEGNNNVYSRVVIGLDVCRIFSLLPSILYRLINVKHTCILFLSLSSVLRLCHIYESWNRVWDLQKRDPVVAFLLQSRLMGEDGKENLFGNCQVFQVRDCYKVCSCLEFSCAMRFYFQELVAAGASQVRIQGFWILVILPSIVTRLNDNRNNEADIITMFTIVPSTIISTFHIFTNLFLVTTLQGLASIYRGGTDAWWSSE